MYGARRSVGWLLWKSGIHMYMSDTIFSTLHTKNKKFFGILLILVNDVDLQLKLLIEVLI